MCIDQTTVQPSHNKISLVSSPLNNNCITVQVLRAYWNFLRTSNNVIFILNTNTAPKFQAGLFTKISNRRRLRYFPFGVFNTSDLSAASVLNLTSHTCFTISQQVNATANYVLLPKILPIRLHQRKARRKGVTETVYCIRLLLRNLSRSFGTLIYFSK